MSLGFRLVHPFNQEEAFTAEAEEFVPRKCDLEAEKIVGERPFRIDKNTGSPRKTRSVAPNYPRLPKGTTVRIARAWSGDVLIDTTGHVVRVWTIREVAFTPPFPAFNDAIVDAIRQWKFEPYLLAAKPVPVCMAVSMNINWA
jgi:hypothetical protein